MKGKLFPQIYDIKTLWQAWNRKKGFSTEGIGRVGLFKVSCKSLLTFVLTFFVFYDIISSDYILLA